MLVVAVEELWARHCGVTTMRRRRGSEETRLVCRRRFDRVGWLVLVDWEVNLLEDPLIWGGLNSKFKAISPIIKNHTILMIGICASAARAIGDNVNHFPGPVSKNILKAIITKPACAVFDLIELAGIEFASGRELSAGSGLHSCIRRES